MRPYTQDEHIAGLVSKHGMGTAHDRVTHRRNPSLDFELHNPFGPHIGYFILLDENGYPAPNSRSPLNPR